MNAEDEEADRLRQASYEIAMKILFRNRNYIDNRKGVINGLRFFLSKFDIRPAERIKTENLLGILTNHTSPILIEALLRQAGINPNLNLAPETIFAINTAIDYLKGTPELNIYPEEEYYILTEAISKFVEDATINKDNVLLGNQPSELYEWLIDLFINEGDAITVIAQGDAEFDKEEERLKDSATRDFSVLRQSGFGIKEFSSKVILISNEDSYYSQEQIDEFIDRVPEDVLVIINEGENTFGEPTKNNLRYVNSDKKVVSIRSFPHGLKFHPESLSFLLARPEVISEMLKIKQPFNVNCIDIYITQRYLEEYGPEAKMPKVKKPGLDKKYEKSLIGMLRDATKNPELKPYKPGDGPKATLAGLEERMPGFNIPLAKLSSNENPEILPRRVIDALIRKLERIRDGEETFDYKKEFGLTKEAIALEVGVKQQNIFLGHAGSEAILRAISAFCKEGDTIVMPQGAFLLHKLVALIKGINKKEVPNKKDFSTDFDGLLKAVIETKPKVFILANPRNPLGTVVDREHLNRFIDDVRKASPETMIIIDEAYYGYAKYQAGEEGWEYSGLVNDFIKKGGIIVRSFSKEYGLAGMRAGYAVASEKTIDRLNKLQRSDSLSAWAMPLIKDVLKEKVWRERVCKTNYKHRNYLLKRFRELRKKFPQFVFPDEVRTSGNFLFFGIKSKEAKEIVKQLVGEGGLIIRDIIAHFLRVTIGTKAECQRFVKAIGELMSSDVSPIEQKLPLKKSLRTDS